ncbi:hypothetical protein QN277_016107 [Acacia crassicarpa]|uniref:BTB domain-containing protein n=1 Tax=Acacia crassicarpa TaxID=499986 RepID=A0AAE1TA90_9FABA|nr:hypothetical protein QN277_016107 [Acacia crassicarpa]
MGDSTCRVETTSRLAQWRIDNSATCTYRKSDPFKIGMWNWYLTLEKHRSAFLRLYPEMSDLSREKPPIASLILRVVNFYGDRKTLTYSEIKDRLIKPNEEFAWQVEVPQTGKFIIDIEFLDLKTASPKDEPCSIWDDQIMQKASDETALHSLGLMLEENIHTDIMINVADGSIQAHRAVLAARSPVFKSMFSYNLKEKESSAIDMPDMSVEACQAFLSYIYGSIKHEEFLAHRLVLLHAADKYDIPDLKEACQQSLLKDIDSKNVLERLQNACLHELPELKKNCLQYLVKFGKLYDIRDDFQEFVQYADRDLIAEIFNEMIISWKGF